MPMDARYCPRIIRATTSHHQENGAHNGGDHRHPAVVGANHHADHMGDDEPHEADGTGHGHYHAGEGGGDHQIDPPDGESR